MIRALSPSPVRTAWAMQASLMTGSIPGMAASTKATFALGSAPKAVEAPEKSLAFVATCAWTSRPITSSQSALAPWITLGFGGVTARSSMAVIPLLASLLGQGPRAGKRADKPA